jgi:hypothetical protein
MMVWRLTLTEALHMVFEMAIVWLSISDSALAQRMKPVEPDLSTPSATPTQTTPASINGSPSAPTVVPKPLPTLAPTSSSPPSSTSPNQGSCNKKSIDLSIFKPGLQVFIKQSTVVENGKVRTIGFLDRKLVLEF